MPICIYIPRLNDTFFSPIAMPQLGSWDYSVLPVLSNSSTRTKESEPCYGHSSNHSKHCPGLQCSLLWSSSSTVSSECRSLVELLLMTRPQSIATTTSRVSAGRCCCCSDAAQEKLGRRSCCHVSSIQMFSVIHM